MICLMVGRPVAHSLTDQIVHHTLPVANIYYIHTGCFFTLGLPLKVQTAKKLIQARLGVSRTIYVNVDSPNLGFTCFNF